MSFSLKDLRKTLDAFESSSWDEIHLLGGDVELHLTTGRATEADLTNADGVDHTLFHKMSDVSAKTSDNSRSGDRTADPTRSRDLPESATATAAVSAAAATDAEAEAEFTQVTAPSVGIFWRSPRPGAPPFAEIGDEVQPGTTLCIVEVMKLMNHVKAETPGRIVEVLVDNGASVQQGQPLFRIARDR